MRAVRSGRGLLAGDPRRTPKQWFAGACRKAGLADYAWHCNRYTFASRLVMAGAPLRDVREFMGHKSIQMTRRYAHLAPQHKLDLVRLLDGWGQADSGVQAATRTATGPLAVTPAVPAKRSQAAVQ
jgi:hypothetical protein